MPEELSEFILSKPCYHGINLQELRFVKCSYVRDSDDHYGAVVKSDSPQFLAFLRTQQRPQPWQSVGSPAPVIANEEKNNYDAEINAQQIVAMMIATISESTIPLHAKISELEATVKSLQTILPTTASGACFEMMKQMSTDLKNSATVKVQAGLILLRISCLIR